MEILIFGYEKQESYENFNFQEDSDLQGDQKKTERTVKFSLASLKKKMAAKKGE